MEKLPFVSVSLIAFMGCLCMQIFALLFYPLTMLYNGESGKEKKLSKKFFYLFYPGYLIILWLIAAAIQR